MEEKRQVTIDSTTPETLTNTIYTPAFLRQYIGKLMRVEFLIGNNFFEDRTGVLADVGSSYIVLRPIENQNNLLYCDIYSIKFVTITNEPFVYNPEYRQWGRRILKINRKLCEIF